jgi:hypothetical protein
MYGFIPDPEEARREAGAKAKAERKEFRIKHGLDAEIRTPEGDARVLKAIKAQWR